jgi:hypothetical protein
MIQKLLTIAIPTTPERLKCFGDLRHELNRQRVKHGLLDNTEIIFDDAGKEMTVGEKRELLYQKASGLFCVQWDDDDSISEDGLFKIVTAIQLAPSADCITYQEYVDIDGVEYKSRHSLQYDDWEGDGHVIFPDGYHYHRTPFFKSAIKTEIANIVPVPHIRFGEDHQWAQSLKPLLKSEVHIPEQIYRYIHRSSNPTERYGLDRQ